jgi:hypothetical protein
MASLRTPMPLNPHSMSYVTGNHPRLFDALVVDVLIKKYGSPLPLYRQRADLERDYNIELSRSTLP